MIKIMTHASIIKISLLLMLAACLSGCGTLGYYGQAALGQISILVKRKPIEGIINGKDASPELKEKLRLILAVREFAEKELHLPAEGSYRTYVELNRPHAVWVLHAAPEFSLTPRSWCYPVAGCMTYRGYFSEKDARDHGRRLKAEGYDVHVGGVSAYSTLGWFDDPVLSTFISYPEAELASLIFHELAHQLLYVKGNTMFNESFAVAVEQEGVRRWMAAAGKSGDYPEFKADYDRRRAFVALLLEAREKLEALYAGPLSPERMREEKKGIFRELEEGYKALKAAWNGYAGYDGWFRIPVNNARLNTVSTYYELVPMFHGILAACKGDLPLFFRRCRELAEEKNGLPGEGR